MSEKSTEAITISEDMEIFHILDERDEQQIIQETNNAMKQALIYTVPWYNPKTKQYEDRDQCSYEGIKYLVILLGQKLKQGLKLAIQPKFELMTIFDPETQVDRQSWHCSLSVLNEITGLETPGVSEQFVQMKVKDKDKDDRPIWDDVKKEYKWHWKYDEFAQRKCLSKALRNAWDLQVPTNLKLQLIQIAKSEKRVDRVEIKKNCICEPGKRDIDPTTHICRRCGGKAS